MVFDWMVNGAALDNDPTEVSLDVQEKKDSVEGYGYFIELKISEVWK